MKRSLTLVALLLLLVFGCQAQPASSPDEIKKLVTSGAIVIDVRSKDEFDSGHLPQARHLPHDQILDLPKTVELKKDTPLVLYCQSGRRSGLATKALQDAGYTQVYNAGSYSDLKTLLGE